MEPNIFYATVNHEFYNILRVGIVRVGRLLLSQEEADTRMFFLVKRSLQYFQENFIISSPDAHVFLLLLMVSENIFVKIPIVYMQIIKQKFGEITLPMSFLFQL